MSPQVQLALRSEQCFTTDRQTTFRSQPIVEVCGVAQGEGGKPQAIQRKHLTGGQNKTAAAAARFYSRTLHSNVAVTAWQSVMRGLVEALPGKPLSSSRYEDR